MKHKRVMAYQLAKKVERKKDLEDIAGGANPSYFTAYCSPTLTGKERSKDSCGDQGMDF
ncbi:Uncharacterised protein (plasmid) [Legionella adelaidensis]|uniref:Uncharacterized protein n=1 Tax=Legionella adelaidensis TaxID=45056 RepID=A0A0W0R137_9GAMM|nr:hypothetical protein [Legionella adelaidensis]KTC64812.1 hypothetical protein Lade_2106 [Legionella adelaidensis]VEH86198.1 Uncharacterised protein [Legionella adelaidensis]